MFTLAATDTLAGIAGTAASITATLFGMELSAAGVETYKKLAQAQLGVAAATIYTAPGTTQAFIKSIHLANTTAFAVSGIALYVKGTAAANRVTGSFMIPANGWAVCEEDGWRFYDANGSLQKSVPNNVTNVFMGRDGADADPFPMIVPGKDGRPGGHRYVFNSSTVTAADPGDGKFTLNATPQSFLATTLSISRKNADGTVIALLLQQVMNTGADSILTFKSADGTKIIGMTVAAASLVDNSTYYTLTVAPLAGVATGDGQEFFLDMVRSGTEAGYRFAFSTGTSGDPGAGKFLVNNGVFTSATTVNISHTDGRGMDVSAALQRMMNTGTSCLMQGFMRDTTRQSAFITLGGFVNNGTYDTYNIRPIINTALNGDVEYFVPSRYGDPGPQGASSPIPGRDGDDADPWPVPFVIPNLNAPARFRFDANKGGVPQTGIANSPSPSYPPRKITFTNEAYDDGGYYDAPNSKWIPPAGFVQIAATIYSYNDPTRPAGANSSIVLFKNGAAYKQLNAFCVTANGAISVGAIFFDKANGTDYYEIYFTVALDTGGTYDVYHLGSNFSGIWLNT